MTSTMKICYPDPSPPREDFFTWGEIEAYRLIADASGVQTNRDDIHACADYIIALADRIREERQKVQP